MGSKEVALHFDPPNEVFLTKSNGKETFKRSSQEVCHTISSYIQIA